MHGPAAESHLPPGAGKRETYVTLRTAGQLAAIAVASVRDVLGGQRITRIPLAPPSVAGSLNLRGRIVTAIDLAIRLGLAGGDPRRARISMVVEQDSNLYALLVDEVGEVVSLAAAGLEENPPTLDRCWRQVARGIHRLEDRLLVVLDVGRLLDLGGG